MKTKRLLLAAAILAAPIINHAQVTFTKIPIDTGYNYAGAAWVDIDNDGYVDLLVANGVATSGGDNNVLYRNNGNGTFTKTTSGVLPSDVGYSLSVAAGDYDNDGLPDLFFGGAFGPTSTVASLFYHNTGGGDFERIDAGALASKLGNFIASWVDYDNDGLLDIFLANTNGQNYLFRNQGDGSFAIVTPAIPAHASGGNLVNGAAWADYDNDGFMDLFIFGGAGHNLLFHNERNGKFTQVHGAPFDVDSGPSGAAAWGDYDNDGYLDLVVTTGNFDTVLRRNYLYHNNGNGTFTKVTTGAIATDLSSSLGPAWEDFDNDGYLDLFVSQSTGSGPARKNLLYHNNGDGTFTSLTNTATTADSGFYAGVAWADYDQDGFPDLFVAAGQPSFIYHNEGNANHWIGFKLVGTQSNRSAIGAKVRVKATIGGKTYWQMRHISNGDGINGNSLNPHFGLGDATNAETVRIEWPSGTVQELQNVAAQQFLTLTEPARLMIGTGGTGTTPLILNGGRTLRYDIQTGTDLATWSLLSSITITNINGTVQITPTNAPGSGRQFYRAVLH